MFRDFLEICDDGYQRRSTVLTSQMPVAHRHEQIADPSIAHSSMDRWLHNALRIELNESIRKKRSRKPVEEESTETIELLRRLQIQRNNADETLQASRPIATAASISLASCRSIRQHGTAQRIDASILIDIGSE